MRQVSRLLLTGIFVAATCTGWVNSSDAMPDSLLQAAETITAGEMMYTIGVLASGECAGRLTGQPGQIKAAEFVAGEFSGIGLAPYGDAGGYFQYFQTPTNIIDETPIIELMLGDDVISYHLGEQCLFRGFTGSGDVTAPICFAGYGITDEYIDYDDYTGIDATGKWVLCLRGWHRAFPDSTFDWAYTGYKARNARSHGAVGLLLVGAGADGIVEVPIGSYLYGLPADEMHADFPMLHVGMDFVNDLFGHQGWYLPGIVSKVDSGVPQGFDFPSDVKAHVKVKATFDADAPTANVIGLLPGTDAKLASRAVIVCAHHDHVGYQDGVIFPGPDDNASGTAALIAIAEAAECCYPQPSRTIIFISFSGEEMGLLGSKYFVDNPLWPLDDIDYVINLDMIGEGEKLSVWGGTDFPKMKKLFAALGEEYGMEIENMPPYPVSDHGPFVEHGIEAVMLLGSGGREDDLIHRPCVYSPDMINREFLEKTARIAFVAAMNLAG